jgi:hypothetical protein
MIRRLVPGLILCQLALIIGCKGDAPPPVEKKPVFPVSGIVHIDGKPVANVNVFLNPQESAPSDQSTIYTASAKAVTDEAGKFVFGTYAPGDGLPVGNYVMSFYWEGGLQISPIAVRDTDDPPKLNAAADSFNRKYGTPSTSKQQFTVEDGKPVDLGVLDLKSR